MVFGDLAIKIIPYLIIQNLSIQVGGISCHVMMWSNQFAMVGFVGLMGT